MRTIERIVEMQHWADAERARGERIGFVPTMGYLHEGHLSLVQRAKELCSRTVVSIFVNPLQFGPTEDLERYPRDLERDARLLSGEGVDVLFLPSCAEMYPAGFQTSVNVEEVTKGLCGASRPTHFRGVTTVVTKLFLAVKPHVAVFGEKDFQQLVTVRQLVRDLNFDISIVAAPIAREPDGLAMSSRNAYLAPHERAAATVLSRALRLAQQKVASGVRAAQELRAFVYQCLAEEPLARVDYVELVDVQRLRPITTIEGPTLLALAVFFGSTRLIDNCVLEVPTADRTLAAKENGIGGEPSGNV